LFILLFAIAIKIQQKWQMINNITRGNLPMAEMINGLSLVLSQKVWYNN